MCTSAYPEPRLVFPLTSAFSLSISTVHCTRLPFSSFYTDSPFINSIHIVHLLLCSPWWASQESVNQIQKVDAIHKKDIFSLQVDLCAARCCMQEKARFSKAFNLSKKLDPNYWRDWIALQHIYLMINCCF